MMDILAGGTPVSVALVATVVAAWLVPLILLVLVLAGAWIGVRWAFSEELAALRSTALFSELSTAQLRSILRSMVPIEFAPGANIVREGEEGDSFYLIRAGRARHLVKGTERATMGPGTYFGEVSVIDGGVRTATVVAEDNVSALQLTASALRRLLRKYPSIARLIFLRLRTVLQEENAPAPHAEDAPVDQDLLVDLCRRLRAVRDLDWSPSVPAHRWRLRRSPVR
jgi:CRP-like cAMP-binding protein